MINLPCKGFNGTKPHRFCRKCTFLTWTLLRQTRFDSDFINADIWTVQAPAHFFTLFFYPWSMLTSALFNIEQRRWIICCKLFNAKYPVHISHSRLCNAQHSQYISFRSWGGVNKNGNKLPVCRPHLLIFHGTSSLIHIVWRLQNLQIS